MEQEKTRPLAGMGPLARHAIAGFQPTGDGRLHVGNLLGSAAPFAELERSGDKFAMIADVHALSMGRLPEGFARSKARMARELVACGARDRGSLLFEQSRVPELLALQALLAPFASLGDLRRMTQFEHKSKSAEGEPLALLAYPCLMAADILGLGALDVVVGEDQRQHLELARVVSARVKARMGVDLGEPRALVLAAAARVKSLRDPASKMSKSEADASGAVFVTDSRSEIARKVRRAVTDPQPLPGIGEPFDEAARPGAANLVDIAARCLGQGRAEILARVAGQGHSALKELAVEALDARLDPIRRRFEGIGDAEALALCRVDAERAREVAARRFDALRSALG